MELFLHWQRTLPLLFVVTALLFLLADALYAPSNGSSTAYQIPRMMHWLAAGQWHWIRTADVRVNIAAYGFEWIFAPMWLAYGKRRIESFAGRHHGTIARGGNLIRGDCR